jgi:deoxycytidine triphosphate deaminase
VIQLDDTTAQTLAEPFKMSGQNPVKDPFPKSPAALLSADDIIKYVEKTGMISPFDGRSGDKSPLKAASYESKIGSEAFIYEKGVNYPKKIYDGSQDYLEIPANSIVFVESDIYFRLPPFMAVRFNLQINHVHRGLLLGTGPLVDPGFWGKLCIPLHNLTNEPYHIAKDDGLIWIEFTKTSSNPTHGRPPSNTDSPNIKRMIEKAAKPIFEDAAPIAIRSSIPDMVEEANDKAQKAANLAKDAENSAKSLRNWSVGGILVGALSAMGLAATVAGLSWQYYDDNQTDIGGIRDKTTGLEKSFDQHVKDVDRYASNPNEAKAALPALKGQVEQQRVEIDKLLGQVSKLRSELDIIKLKLCDRNRPDIKCP